MSGSTWTVRALALVATLLVGSCSDDGSRGTALATPTSPAPPAPSPVALPSGYANFFGEVTVVSLVGESHCEWTPGVEGTTYEDRWWAAFDAHSFSLSRDPVDGPVYSGEAAGLAFDDSEVVGDNYLAQNCQLRESSIRGLYTADFGWFEAHEIQIFGPPEREFRVELRHWAARR